MMSPSDQNYEHSRQKLGTFLENKVFWKTNQSSCQTQSKNLERTLLICRFFPIGPNIQPTLTENWVSALFEFGGRDPVGFSTVVTIFLTLVIGALVSAWGLLGFYLGKFKI